MAIRDILVYLDANDPENKCLDAAVGLAKRKQAHLIGVAFALESSLLQFYGEKFAPELHAKQESIARAATDAAVNRFNQITRQAEVSAEVKVVEATIMNIAEKLAFLARHVDIVFLEQPNPDRPNRQLLASLLDGVLFNTGRPAYIAPYVGLREVSVRKAVIAWDGGYKAARAVNDAIPLLQDRGETTVLVIDGDKHKGAHGPKPGADIKAHLERHGINAEIEKYPSGDFGIATTILNYVSDGGADLLILGAYGHSRIRERAFGGVTRTILQQMTVPVLMAN